MQQNKRKTGSTDFTQVTTEHKCEYSDTVNENAVSTGEKNKAGQNS